MVNRWRRPRPAAPEQQVAVVAQAEVLRAPERRGVLQVPEQQVVLRAARRPAVVVAREPLQPVPLAEAWVAAVAGLLRLSLAIIPPRSAS